MGWLDSGAFARGLIGLYIWNKIWRGSEELLTDVEASIVETLWTHGRRRARIDIEDAFAEVNQARRVHDLDVVTSTQFERALDRLVIMDCIELIDGRIWLRESVRKRT